jgi:type IV secretion system protein VirB2
MGETTKIELRGTGSGFAPGAKLVASRPPVRAPAASQRAASLATFLSAGLAAGAARAQSVQLDPPGSNVILTAVDWLQGTLLGNVATALAVIAVGATGLLMLTGRIDWRRGATVILGCFIVFGAAAIVAGIRSVAAGS